LHAVAFSATFWPEMLATADAMAHIFEMLDTGDSKHAMTNRDSLAAHGLFWPIGGSPAVEWRISDGLVDYKSALAEMEARVSAIRDGTAPEIVWLLEHPSLYTAGTSADPQDLVAPDRFPVFQTGRGGEYTYHGPGQRVAYVMLDLKRRKEDVRAFVAALEEWIIRTLDRFNIKGERREDRVGVWVVRPEKASTIPGQSAEDKIAAIGIRLRKWVSFHGIAINHEPDLSHFDGIVPCGVTDHGVTSLVDLGLPVTMNDLDLALLESFREVFGPVGEDQT
jgi:lipoyl(octanoyl) transferase